MNIYSLILGSVTVTGLFSATNVRATLFASDTFNYPAGSIVGLNGGSGFTGAYTANGGGLSVGTSALSYTDSNGNILAGTGNAIELDGGNNGVFRSLTDVPETVGSTLYLSYLMQLNTSTGYAGLSLFDAGNEVLFTGRPGNTPDYGIDTKDGTSIGTTVNATSEALLVYQINISANSTTVNLFVDPTLGTQPATPTLTATINSELIFDSIRVQAGSDDGVISDLNIGSTFADVTPIEAAVPEPSTMAGGLAGALVGGFGILGMVRRRRA